MSNKRVGEDSSEDGRPERATNGVEERRAGCCCAKVTVINGVLYRNHQHLHDQSQCQSKYRHMTTHDNWFSPPRLLTIVGSAVATTVWPSDAINIPSISPLNTIHTPSGSY